MDDIIQLISKFDARINTPEETDDIKELSMIRGLLVGHIVKQSRAPLGKVKRSQEYLGAE